MRILNHKETKHLSRPLPSKETELVIKNLQTKKIPGPDGFTGELYEIFKKEIAPISYKFFQKTREYTFQLILKVRITPIVKLDTDVTKERKLQTNLVLECR